MKGDRDGSMPFQSQDVIARTSDVLALIRNQRTMVIATGSTQNAWAAPVYFVYSAPRFYFFSSPHSRHIEQSQAAESVAAAIFTDSDEWEKIQGLQMSGRIQLVIKKTEQIKIGARFIMKFPFAEPFLHSDKGGKGADGAPNVADRVKLYAFVPSEIYYVNNRTGFGKKMQITLP